MIDVLQIQRNKLAYVPDAVDKSASKSPKCLHVGGPCCTIADQVGHFLRHHQAVALQALDKWLASIYIAAPVRRS
jgi:hypothetical protein